MSLNSDQEQATDNRAPRKFPLCCPYLVNTLISFISILGNPQSDDFPKRPRVISPSAKNSNQSTSAIGALIGTDKSISFS
jgi:hypothetical protein